MKKYNPSVPLAFIHIPKTAGTSVLNIFKSWFEEKLIHNYVIEKSNTHPNIDLQNDNNICFAGHFNRNRNRGIEQLYPDIDQYVTFLRDPFEAHLSNYFYVKKLEKEGKAFWNGKIHPIVEQKLSLSDYLEKYKYSCYLHFLPKDISKSNFIEILNKKYIFIGLAEDINKSIEILAKKLNKQFIPPPSLNISKREEIENIDKYKKIFIKNNCLEYLIYNYVKQNYKLF